MHKQNLVVGLPMVRKIEDICESCVYEKQHRVPFQVGKSWRANVNHVSMENNIEYICKWVNPGGQMSH